MTILDNIPEIIYQTQDTHMAIINNSKIEDKLHVITVISNPCNYKRRIYLTKEFIKRMEKNNQIILYVVELIYNQHNTEFTVTNPDNKRHLQLQTSSEPLWHKENMINIGIKKLLPRTWKAVAWIDADIEFDNVNWSNDTLKILNGYKDIIQLFTLAIDMDKYENTQKIFHSFGYKVNNQQVYIKDKNNYFHPGFAWACTRKAYEKMNGIYENSILGSGDHNMALSFIANSQKSVNENVSDNYKIDLINFEKKACNFRIGYVPGVIKHYYHGSKINRKYQERWVYLVKHKYDPLIHVKKDSNGLIIPNTKFPQELKDDILQYFSDRKEDE